METPKKLRKQLDKKLRCLARLASVEQVRADSSREKVQAMVRTIIAKGCASTVAQAKETFGEFEKTWAPSFREKRTFKF